MLLQNANGKHKVVKFVQHRSNGIAVEFANPSRGSSMYTPSVAKMLLLFGMLSCSFEFIGSRFVYT